MIDPALGVDRVFDVAVARRHIRSIKAVGDGDVIGLQIIATPGHTPGHFCVFDPVGSLLVAGDAMVNLNNRLGGANPQYTADMDKANESLR